MAAPPLIVFSNHRLFAWLAAAGRTSAPCFLAAIALPENVIFKPYGPSLTNGLIGIKSFCSFDIKNRSSILKRWKFHCARPRHR